MSELDKICNKLCKSFSYQLDDLLIAFMLGMMFYK